MEGSAAREASPSRGLWHPPVPTEQYDHSPLTAAEREALAVILDSTVPSSSTRRRAAQAALVRLSRPLHEVYALRHQDTDRRVQATRVVFGQMHRRGRAFWQWTPREWHEVVGATGPDFAATNQLVNWDNGLRLYLLDVAYLLCGFDEFGPVWSATTYYPMARVVFGAGLLDGQLARLDTVLANEGYATGHSSIKQRHQAMAFLLLLHRSP